MAPSNSQNYANELFGQAARSFESAVQAGIKLQAESVKFLTDVLSEMGSPQKWQKKAQAVMSEMVNTSQNNIGEAIKVMNENAKTSLDVLQKAFQSQPNGTEEAQSRTLEVWETTLGILRKNTEAVLRANTRVVEAWTEMAKKVNGEQMERMAQMAQKAAQAATTGASG
jgi:hypothetical protein